MTNVLTITVNHNGDSIEVDVHGKALIAFTGVKDTMQVQNILHVVLNAVFKSDNVILESVNEEGHSTVGDW